MSKEKLENQTKEKLLHPSSRFKSPKAREHWMQQRSKGEGQRLFDSADGATCCSKFLHQQLSWNFCSSGIWNPGLSLHCSSSFSLSSMPCSPEKHNKHLTSRIKPVKMVGGHRRGSSDGQGRGWSEICGRFGDIFTQPFFLFLSLFCYEKMTYLPVTVASRIYLFSTLFSLMRSFRSLPRLATWWPPLWRKTSIWRFWLKPTYPSCISKANPTDRKASPAECHHTVTWW